MLPGFRAGQMIRRLEVHDRTRSNEREYVTFDACLSPAYSDRGALLPAPTSRQALRALIEQGQDGVTAFRGQAQDGTGDAGRPVGVKELLVWGNAEDGHGNGLDVAPGLGR